MSLFNSIVTLALPLTPRPVVGFFARRYVAGESLDDAVATVHRLARTGCAATIDVLGEAVESREQATAAVADYHRVLAAIEREKLDANVSLKPTQLGLSIDEAMCRDNIAAVLEQAHSMGIFLRIDMEDSPTTDATLRVFHDLIRRFPDGCGVVLQARLHRTLADARTLAAERASVRLCKGIYLEPRRIAWQERDIIRNAYVHALTALAQGGGMIAIATHDEWLVAQAMAIIEELGLDRSKVEFQMLLGVDPELRRIIVDAGHRLRVYVPFGSHWYPYSVRRLRENPTIVGAALDAFLHGRMER